MKKASLLFLCVMLMIASTVVFAEENPVEDKKKIVVLATGGTIAGVGETGKIDGYKAGTLTVDDLLSEIPELADIADYEAIQMI